MKTTVDTDYSISPVTSLFFHLQNIKKITNLSCHLPHSPTN